MPVQYDDMIIQHETQLAAFCDAARTSPALYLDTEFVGEGRYYPEVGAIQVATAGQAVLIDPLAVRNLAPLQPLLTEPGIIKVFHAAGQDLQIFYRLFNQPVAPVFDTQIAAALLGSDEQISFANLVERVTGITLLKSHGFTDWLRRPLSTGQIEYALDDVRLLVPVYEHQSHELAVRGRSAWVAEEHARLENVERYQPVDPYLLYQRLRGADRLRGQALALLRELAAWREETARAKNLPVGRVARDEVLLELARHPRTSLTELKEVRGLQPSQVDRFGPDLLEALRRGSTAPRPTIKRAAPLLPALEPTVDFLVLCLRSLAGELSVAPGMVATRADLTALVMHGEEADTPLLRGWRRAAIGDALLATLEGKATARITPQSRQVHLDWHGEETPVLLAEAAPAAS